MVFQNQLKTIKGEIKYYEIIENPLNESISPTITD